MEFTFADLSAAGYQIQPSQTAAAMKKHGFVEQIDRRQGVNVYRLIESEIRGE
jgi:hypothetical protein